jgi:nucleotide-binding universal stress UspA family protein
VTSFFTEYGGASIDSTYLSLAGKKEGFREQIIHRAEADGIDLIIVGRRGRFMISRMMLGSVSKRVLRYAHCPVMVVH